MKLPDAVIDRLQDSESPVTHAVTIQGGSMIIRYTCDGKAIGQTMFHYTPETYVDWFHSMMKETNPGASGSAKKNKVKTNEKNPPTRTSHSRKRESRRRG
jgi:hypothetical protein